MIKTRVPMLAFGLVLAATGCDIEGDWRGEGPGFWGEGEGWAPELQYDGRGLEHVSATDVWWEGGEVISFDGSLVVVDTGAGTCDFSVNRGMMLVDRYFETDDIDVEDHDGDDTLVASRDTVYVATADSWEGNHDATSLPGVVDMARFSPDGGWVALHHQGEDCSMSWSDGATRPVADSYCDAPNIALDDAGMVWIPAGDHIAAIDRWTATQYAVAADEIAWDSAHQQVYAQSGSTVTALQMGTWSLNEVWSHQTDGELRDFGGSDGFAAVLSRGDNSVVEVLDGATGEVSATMSTWQNLNKLHVAADAPLFTVRGVGAIHNFRLEE